MDKEHQVLVDQAEQLFEALRMESYKGDIQSAIQLLMDYAVNHFNSEEVLVKKTENMLSIL